MRLSTLLVLAGAGVTTALLATPSAALAAWDAAAPTATGGAEAIVLPAGPSPTTKTSKSSATVTWRAVDPASAYRVLRQNAETGLITAAGRDCAGVLTGRRCTETALPDGMWRYGIQALVGDNWNSEPTFGAVVVISTEEPPPPVAAAPDAPMVTTPGAPQNPAVSPEPAPTRAPAKPTGPAKLAQPTESAEPTKPTEPAEPTKSAEPTQPAKPIEPIEPSAPTPSPSKSETSADQSQPMADSYPAGTFPAATTSPISQ